MEFLSSFKSCTGFCQFYEILLCNLTSYLPYKQSFLFIYVEFFSKDDYFCSRIWCFSLNTDDFYPFQWDGSVHRLLPRCHTFSDDRRAVSERRAGSLCLHPRPWYMCSHQIYASSCCHCHEKVVNNSHHLMIWDWHDTGCFVSVRGHSIKKLFSAILGHLFPGLPQVKRVPVCVSLVSRYGSGPSFNTSVWDLYRPCLNVSLITLKLCNLWM